MKKILFVTPYLGGGGAERVLIDLINTLNKKEYQSKFKVTLFTIGSGVLDSQLNRNVKHIKVLNNDLASTEILTKVKIKVFNKIMKLLSPQCMRRVLNLYLRETYDIEIAFLEGLPIKFVSNSSSKKIGWIHSNLNELFFSSRFFKNKIIEKNTYDKMDETIFVSEDSYQGYKQFFGNTKTNMRIIGNIVNYNKIEKTSLEETGLDFPYICSVGRLSKEKGYDRLIEVYNNLKQQEKLDGLKLVIVGSGNKEEELRSLIRGYELEKDIILIPFSDNPYKYVRNCKFFISSSLTEGYPLVVVEALILGVPVLVTETGAVSVVEHGKYGMIVENSKLGIEKGILTMLNKLPLYQKKAIEGSKNMKIENDKKVKQILDVLLDD